MIVVIANVIVKPGMASKYIETAQNCISETRKESGNVSYVLYASTEDDCKLSFVEEWQSQEALNAHMQTPHFKALMEASADLTAGAGGFSIYEGVKVN